MKSRCASFVLVVAVCAAGATVAAQVAAPPSPQPVPQGTASTPVRPAGQAQAASGVSRPGATAANLGPIIATGTNAAYVSAEATGHPAVFIGSDASPYGIVGTFSNHPLGFRTNNIPRLFIDTSGKIGIGKTTPGYSLDVSGDANITGTYRVNGVPISATANWTQAGNNIYYTTGNVGIASPTPVRSLQVGSGAIPGSEGMIRLESISSSGIAYRSWDVGVPMTGDDASIMGYSFVIDDTLSGGPEFIVKWGTGNVGIGTPFPAAKLDVSGTVRATSFAMPTTTRYLSLPAAAFHGMSNIFDWATDLHAYGLTPGQSIGFTAPVLLPDGAIVTRMDVAGFDNAPGNMTVRLWYQTDDSSVGVIAEVSSSGASASHQTWFTTSIGEGTIDNANRGYHIEATWTTPDFPVTNLEVDRVRITYTIAAPLP